MIKISASVFSFLVVLGFSSTSWATPAQVLIIRHAEKPASGPDLSPQGYQHAQELVSYFESNPEVTQYGRPFAIYAMANNSADSGLRPIETVTPLAHALGLSIQDQYGKDDTQAVAEEILQNPAYDGKMVLICWEHKHIPLIAQALGATNAPSAWSGSDFDSVWEIDYASGHPIFTEFEQQLGQQSVQPAQPQQPQAPVQSSSRFSYYYDSSHGTYYAYDSVERAYYVFDSSRRAWVPFTGSSYSYPSERHSKRPR